MGWFGALLTIIASILPKFLGGSGGQKDSNDRQLGRLEANKADVDSGIDLINKAEEAARKARAREEGEHDPHDLAGRE